MDNGYFSVAYAATVNLLQLNDGEQIPSLEDFEGEIPMPFRMSHHFTFLESSAQQQLQKLHGVEATSAIMEYLNVQNVKLDLLLNHALSQEIDDENKYTTHTLGGSRFTVTFDHEPILNAQYRIKLFLVDPSYAVYAYATITEVEEQDESFLVTFEYSRILEADEDKLIRAALHQQQKMLRKRAQDRKNK